jgi:signal peptidase I
MNRSAAEGKGKAARGRADEAREDAESSATRVSRGVWEQISTLLVAVLIALAIRAFVIEPYRIPSGSMFPTLLVGDHLFVNKFIYGIKLPFTTTRLPGLREPERGDIAVFTVAQRGTQTYPADRRPDLPREEFVKRIIGLPGDEITFRGGRVYVNGEPIEVRNLDETFKDDTGSSLGVSEVKMGDRSFRILDDPRVSIPGPVETITVEPGRYFMLGDNRDHSKDSRFWGTVRLAELKGPAFILYWSWDFNGTWAELLNPLTLFDLITSKTRWDRIGDGVE